MDVINWSLLRNGWTPHSAASNAEDAAKASSSHSQSPAAAEELITRRDPFQPFHTDVGTREMEREVNMRRCGRSSHMPSANVALCGARSVLQLLPYDALDAWYLSISQCQVRKKAWKRWRPLKI